MAVWTGMKLKKLMALATLSLVIGAYMAMTPLPVTARSKLIGDMVTVPANDALTAFNNEARAIYAKAREHYAQTTLPLIICYSDHMVLIDSDVREEINYISHKYTDLKVVDHVALALFSLLGWQCDKALDESTLQELAKLKGLARDMEKSLDKLDWDKDTMDRQHIIIDHCVGLMELTIRRKEISKDKLDSVCQEIEPLIMQNVDQAVASQLEIMDKAVTAWKAKLGDDRFKNLTVIIVSGHMPRDRHSCFQYFSKALKVKEEGLKIIYSEGEAEEKAALEMVGTHVLDASIGQAFFKDPMRMHRDLLSDGAAKYLKAHPPLQRFSKETSK